MYSHETRTRLVKKRVKEKERQRQLRARFGVLILATLAAGAALGTAAFYRRQPRGG